MKFTLKANAHSPSYAYLVDTTYRKLLGSHIFPAGWGKASHIQALMEFHKEMSNREKCQSLVEAKPTVSLEKVKKFRHSLVFDGHFQSPFAKHLPGLLPPASELCRFQLCIPKEWKTEDRPIAIHMAGTGDQKFWRRRILLVGRLLKEHGIGSVVIENPFYGTRKPPEQVRSNVRYVSDIFVMGGGLMLESLALLRWLENNGYGPFCLTGISMGGHMASLGASNYEKPVGIAPCLSWTTASSVFTRGVMTNAINWKTAKTQYAEDRFYRDKIRDRLVSYELVSPREYQEKVKYFRELAESRYSEAAKHYPELSPKSPPEKSWLAQRLSELVADFRESKVYSMLPSFNFLPPFSLSSAILAFLIGKNSSLVSLHEIIPFLEKLRRQSVSDQSHSQSQLNFEGKDAEQMNEKGIRSFYKIDESTCHDSLDFMHRLMDHFTHLSNFEKPLDPELAIFVAARNDAYVLRDGVTRIEEIWPGCTVRYLDTGHVIAYARHHNEFRQAICDTIAKHREKYYTDGTPRPSSGSKPGKPISIENPAPGEKCQNHPSEVIQPVPPVQPVATQPDPRDLNPTLAFSPCLSTASYNQKISAAPASPQNRGSARSLLDLN